MMKIVTEIVMEWKGITIFLQWFPSIKKMPFLRNGQFSMTAFFLCSGIKHGVFQDTKLFAQAYF